MALEQELQKERLKSWGLKEKLKSNLPRTAKTSKSKPDNKENPPNLKRKNKNVLTELSKFKKLKTEKEQDTKTSPMQAQKKTNNLDECGKLYSNKNVLNKHLRKKHSKKRDVFGRC